jgi:glutathionyl-hydroquinone reductase
MEISYLNKKRLNKEIDNIDEKDNNEIKEDKNEDIISIINSAFDDFIKGNNEQFIIKYNKLEKIEKSQINKK